MLLKKDKETKKITTANNNINKLSLDMFKSSMLFGIAGNKKVLDKKVNKRVGKIKKNKLGIIKFS